MKTIFITMLVVLTTASGYAQADEDSEREALARISYEVERLEQMVKDASADAVTATRVRFQYEWLMRDLQMIRAGIDAHIDSPRQPRPVPPLKGDYRR